MSNFHKNKTATAKRIYQCATCGLTIEIGQELGHHKGVFDGEFYDYRSHIDCSRLANDVRLHKNLEWSDWMGLDEELIDLPNDHFLAMRYVQIKSTKRPYPCVGAADPTKAKEQGEEQ